MKSPLIPHFLILALAVLAFTPAAAESDRIIARDDHQQWTAAVLNEYLKQDGEAQLAGVMAAMDDPASPGRPLLERRMESLAFMAAFVAERAKEPLDAQADWVLRRQLWDWAERKVNAEVEQKIDLTSPTLTAAYNKHKDRYYFEERRKIAILYKAFPSDSESDKAAIIKQLEEWRAQPDINTQFTDYVKRHSDLPGAEQGGIVPHFTRGTYGPTVEKFAFATPMGEVSPVFSATKGAYLIKVLDVIPEGYAPLSEVGGLIGLIAREEQRPVLWDEVMAPLRRKAATLRITLPDDSKPLAPGAAVLQVNDFRLTSGTLSRNDPTLARLIADDSAAAEAALRRLADLELFVQNVERMAEAEPQTPTALEHRIFRLRTEYRIRLAVWLDARVTVDEAEIKAYYEQFKDFYHGPAPKRFAVLEARFPDKAAMPEPIFFKQVEQLRREMSVIQEQLQAAPDEFAARATAWAEARSDARFYRTDLIAEFPVGWQVRKPITSFGLGMVSPVELGDDAFVVFRVEEVGKPDTLPLDDVRDKVERVVRAGKENSLIQNARDELLKKINFRLTLNESASPR